MIHRRDSQQSLRSLEGNVGNGLKVQRMIKLKAATVVATLTDWYNNNRVVAPSHTMDVLKEKKYKRIL